LLAAGSKT